MNAPAQVRHYRIGELAELLGETAVTIRFWESEFRITPARNAGGHRVYSPTQVAKLRLIRWLLHVELYTVAGAKRQLRRIPERDLHAWLVELGGGGFDASIGEASLRAARPATRQDGANSADSSAVCGGGERA